ncbi:MAG: galactitol-1-phosphate 5-dehydrogenase [Oscillospiraceae bacterium]|jgi:L-iditol 2-dehydrogenase|nr:galactitol-1-phosphate 5-dehydrogenase [Oscillospiraceae bacterium]
MKAAVLHGNEDLRYEDFPDPELRPGWVKIRVRAAGICGSDVPRVLKNGAHYYPLILGHEFSGDVAEVGAGVTGLTPGQPVTAAPLVPCMRCADCQKGQFALCKHYDFIGSHSHGAFAEYVCVPAANAVPFDPATPYAQAAMFEPATVALHGLKQNKYRGGGHVAVLGGGTVGMFTLQWAMAYGARTVTVFDVDEERLALGKRLGATSSINTLHPDFIKEAMAATGGQGYDYIFETAGSTATMHMAFDLAANKARICFIGTPTKELIFTPAMWEKMNRREFYLTGSWMSYSAPFPGDEWTLTAEAFASGRLRFDPSFIFKQVPLSQAQAMFDLYKTPGAVKGKIILTP